jgi:hypothetical protein
MQTVKRVGLALSVASDRNQVLRRAPLNRGRYPFLRTTPATTLDQAPVGNPTLEAGVLRLKLLEPLGIQDLHTADFGFSAIPRLFENPVAATGVLAQGSGLDLLQTVR